MSRLGPAFRARQGRTGLIPFVTAGYPTPEATARMLRGFAEAGALAVEIGVPFSDPIADGAEIQRTSEAALARGVGPDTVLELVRELRRTHPLPVVVMSYLNPLLRHGLDRFAAEAGDAGVDGVLVSDLPHDEAGDVGDVLAAHGLDRVLLVAPTTTPERLAGIVARASGFLYCLARTGVTGAATGESGDLDRRLADLRRASPLPIAVGFGIGTASQARALRGRADAVVVGAALMRAAGDGPEGAAADRVVGLARELMAALDES